jgi:UDP-GlcNAc:undecaprenyl-phosphate/decaprenyl-phosphate GlcNAc-1-phosphate transferase
VTRRSGPGAAAGAVIGAALAAAAARGGYAAANRRPPGGAAAWHRTNHRGEPVTLLEGPAVAAGAALAAAVTPGTTARARAALAAAAIGAGAFGGYDDLAGSGGERGFRGHLGALARGEVTTGAVKIGGIGATGLAASARLGGRPVDVLLNAGLIAGGANLLNLFDLRPGRAIKVAAVGGTLLALAAPGRAPSPVTGTIGPLPGGDRRAAGPLVAAPMGAALALAGEDLGERAMLGDAGANALGAMLGTAAAASLGRPARIALLAGIIGLTAASEVVSFTAVIERTPPLRWLDLAGRRPAGPGGPRPAAEPAGSEPTGAAAAAAQQHVAGGPVTGEPAAEQPAPGPPAGPGPGGPDPGGPRTRSPASPT